MEGTLETVQPYPLGPFLRRKAGPPKAAWWVRSVTGLSSGPLIAHSRGSSHGTSEGLLWLWRAKDSPKNIAEGRTKNNWRGVWRAGCHPDYSKTPPGFLRKRCLLITWCAWERLQPPRKMCLGRPVMMETVLILKLLNESQSCHWHTAGRDWTGTSLWKTISHYPVKLEMPTSYDRESLFLRVEPGKSLRRVFREEWTRIFL